MGYTTDFSGEFKITPALDVKTYRAIQKLSDHRPSGQRGNGGQPDSYCQWVPNDDGDGIKWDGNEKFYYYTDWLRYIIDQVLVPGGYALNGEVTWQGEETGDIGMLAVKNNVIAIKKFKVTDADEQIERARARLRAVPSYREALKKALDMTCGDTGAYLFGGLTNGQLNHAIQAALDVASIIEEGEK